MAITATLVGSLGAGKVTTVPFTFNNPRKMTQDIDSTWNIPSGRHLLFWGGVNDSNYSGKVTIDGTLFDFRQSENPVARFLYVDGPKTVVATGDGLATFSGGIYANWVRITS